MLLGQTDTIAQRQAALVATVDADKGARMPTQGEHLLEDREEHQLAQRNLPPFWQLYETAAGLQGDRHYLGVADVGLEGWLDVVGADYEYGSAQVGADQHPSVEAWRRCQVASRQGTANLLLNHLLPRCP